MKKFGKIVGFIGLCLFAVGASYFLTQYLDKNLYLNDKEVKEGNLKDLKDNILYETKIGKKKTDTYKLYVYLTKDIEDIDYTYTIVVNSK